MPNITASAEVSKEMLLGHDMHVDPCVYMEL
jgi:hypothetical protein